MAKRPYVAEVCRGLLRRGSQGRKKGKFTLIAIMDRGHGGRWNYFFSPPNVIHMKEDKIILAFFPKALKSLPTINYNPQRTRFRKQHRGRMKGISYRGNHICFGRYALQALEPAWITSRQIEAGRRAMSRNVRRGGGFLLPKQIFLHLYINDGLSKIRKKSISNC
ncbi:hypothetical protein Lal_00039627 [Lupinus albus]|nr:hypothetical protein Lal_00039627 [Lupinus albus]